MAPTESDMIYRRADGSYDREAARPRKYARQGEPSLNALLDEVHPRPPARSQVRRPSAGAQIATGPVGGYIGPGTEKAESPYGQEHPYTPNPRQGLTQAEASEQPLFNAHLEAMSALHGRTYRQPRQSNTASDLAMRLGQVPQEHMQEIIGAGAQSHHRDYRIPHIQQAVTDLYDRPEDYLHLYDEMDTNHSQGANWRAQLMFNVPTPIYDTIRWAATNSNRPELRRMAQEVMEGHYDTLPALFDWLEEQGGWDHLPPEERSQAHKGIQYLAEQHQKQQPIIPADRRAQQPAQMQRRGKRRRMASLNEGLDEIHPRPRRSEDAPVARPKKTVATVAKGPAGGRNVEVAEARRRSQEGDLNPGTGQMRPDPPGPSHRAPGWVPHIPQQGTMIEATDAAQHELGGGKEWFLHTLNDPEFPAHVRGLADAADVGDVRALALLHDALLDMGRDDLADQASALFESSYRQGLRRTGGAGEDYADGSFERYLKPPIIPPVGAAFLAGSPTAMRAAMMERASRLSGGSPSSSGHEIYQRRGDGSVPFRLQSHISLSNTPLRYARDERHVDERHAENPSLRGLASQAKRRPNEPQLAPREAAPETPSYQPAKVYGLPKPKNVRRSLIRHRDHEWLANIVAGRRHPAHIRQLASEALDGDAYSLTLLHDALVDHAGGYSSGREMRTDTAGDMEARHASGILESLPYDDGNAYDAATSTFDEAPADSLWGHRPIRASVVQHATQTRP